MKCMRKLLAVLCVCALSAAAVVLSACDEKKPPEPAPAVSVSLDKSTASVEEGSTISLTATVTNSTDDPAFTSSDTSKAAVTATGKTATVTGVAAGTVTITASVGDKSASCTVTVTAKPAAELRLDKEFVIMEDGGQSLNTATLTAVSGENVTFESGDSAVVSVASQGNTATLTALKTGETTITAKSGDKTVTCRVEVGTYGLAYELTQLDGVDVLQVKDGAQPVSGDIRIPSKYWSDDEEAFFDVAVIKPRVMDGTTRVSNGAFEENKTITSVYLGNNVIKVGDNAFTKCSKLESVKCGDALKNVGGGAFDECEALTTFDWGNSEVTVIGACAFRFIAATEFSIPATVTEFNYGIFQGAAALQTIKVYAQIEIIYNDTFLQCVALKDIYLPATIKTIQKWAFGLYAGMPDTGREFTLHFAGTEAEWNAVEINAELNETILKDKNEKLTLLFDAEY